MQSTARINNGQSHKPFTGKLQLLDALRYVGTSAIANENSSTVFFTLGSQLT